MLRILVIGTNQLGGGRRWALEGWHGHGLGDVSLDCHDLFAFFNRLDVDQCHGQCRHDGHHCLGGHGGVATVSTTT